MMTTPIPLPDISTVIGALLATINVLTGIVIYFLKKDNDAKEARLKELERIAADEVVRVITFIPFRQELLDSLRRMEDGITKRVDQHDVALTDVQVEVARIQGKLEALNK